MASIEELKMRSWSVDGSSQELISGCLAPVSTEQLRTAQVQLETPEKLYQNNNLLSLFNSNWEFVCWLNILPLPKLYYHHVVFFMYKVEHSLLPAMINQMFEYGGQIH